MKGLLQKLPNSTKADTLTKTINAPVGKLTLPSVLSVPPTVIGAYTLLIYGKRFIGKTSLVSRFPKTFCLMFEPGGIGLSIYQKPVASWEEFIGYIELLEQKRHGFQTVSIDTGRIFYDRCLEYVCREAGVEHPSDVGYGKVWDKIRRELENSFARLLRLKLGVIVVCHEKLGTVKKFSGDEISSIEPLIARQCKAYFSAVIDTTAYYRYDGSNRVLQIQGDDLIEAGTRCENNFFTTTGERITNISMGSSSNEAYVNLTKAFNNKQLNTGKEVANTPQKTVLKKAPAKKAPLKKL